MTHLKDKIVPALARISIGFFLVAASASSAVADEYVFVTEGEVLRHSDVKLSPRQRRAFRQFTRGTKFHGAFFVNTDVEYWSSFVDSHSPASARLWAEEVCKLDTAEFGGECVYYASIRPVALSQTPLGPLRVAKSLAVFASENVHQLEGLTGHIAISAEPRGAWGMSEIVPTREEAIAGSQAECSDIAAGARNDDGASLASILEKHGFYECEVAVLISPD